MAHAVDKARILARRVFPGYIVYMVRTLISFVCSHDD